jgi:hypothetical protein
VASGTELAAVINDFRLHPYCATTPATPTTSAPAPKLKFFARVLGRPAFVCIRIALTIPRSPMRGRRGEKSSLRGGY